MLHNLKFTDWGTGDAVLLDNFCEVIGCEFDGNVGGNDEIAGFGINCIFSCNKVHGIAASLSTNISLSSGSMFNHNYIQCDSNANNSQIVSSSAGIVVDNNVMVFNSTNSFRAIALGDGGIVIGNTLYNDQTGGTGIYMSGGAIERTTVLNNIVEGFSTGILLGSGSNIRRYGSNKYYNNSTNESLSGTVILDLGGNSVLSASAFTSVGNADPNDDDFTVGTEVKAAGYPEQLWNLDNAFGTRNKTFIDVGALQREEAAGGGVALINRRDNSLITR